MNSIRCQIGLQSFLIVLSDILSIFLACFFYFFFHFNYCRIFHNFYLCILGVTTSPNSWPQGSPAEATGASHPSADLVLPHLPVSTNVQAFAHATAHAFVFVVVFLADDRRYRLGLSSAPYCSDTARIRAAVVASGSVKLR